MNNDDFAFQSEFFPEEIPSFEQWGAFLGSTASSPSEVLESPGSSPSRDELPPEWLTNGMESDEMLGLKYEMAVPAPLPQITPLEPTTSTTEEDSDDTEKRGNKRARKKRKTTATTSKAVKNAKVQPQEPVEEDLPLGLSREVLLTFSSTKFEAYVSNLTSQRALTPQEKAELKRQRRLIKNRESAQLSRQRKKNSMEQLEARVQELENDKQRLKEQVASLTSTNAQLEAELLYYRPKGVTANAMTDLLSRGVSFVNNLGKQAVIPPGQANLKAASLVVMVVLFSFGLLFPNFVSPKVLPSPMREPITQVLPGRVFRNHDQFEPTSQSRELMDLLEEQDLPMCRLANQKASTFAHSETALQPVAAEKTVSELLFSSAPVAEKDVLMMDVSSTEVPPTSASQPAVIISSSPQTLHFKPNTTYLLCQNVSQILPPPGMEPPSDPNAPSQIAFLIPPDSLNGANKTGDDVLYHSPYFSLDVYSAPESPDDKPKSLLEVTCSVMDMNFIPMDGSESFFDSMHFPS